MDWLDWVASWDSTAIWGFFVAICLVVGYESLTKRVGRLHGEIWDLKVKNKLLEEQVTHLTRNVDALENQVRSLKDPAYYAALDAGDYETLRQIDLNRNGGS